MNIIALENFLNNDIKLTIGKIEKIKENFEFKHSIYNYNNCFSYPFILAKNLNLIGLNIKNEQQNNYNIGVFTGILSKELKPLILNENKNDINKINNKENEEEKNNENIYNRIKIIYKKEEENIQEYINIFGIEFVENNKNKCNIKINGDIIPLCSSIIKNIIKEDNFAIELIEYDIITDMSYMFSECES